MRNIIIKIILIVVAGTFLFYLFYSPTLKFDVLQNPKKVTRTTEPINSKKEAPTNLPKLEKGVGTFVGQDVSNFIKSYGYPTRIYDSSFSYENQIYKDKDQYYILGVKNNKIVSVYATGMMADIHPFKVGMQSDVVFNGNQLVSEPIIKTSKGQYRFELSEVDIKTLPLIEYDNVFAQVFIDRISNKIMAIQYMNKEHLIEVQPYAMSYNGETIERTANKDEHKLSEVAKNSNKVLTMFELTNMMRVIQGRDPINSNEQINNIAQKEVLRLMDANEETPTVVNDEIGKELDQRNISYKNLAQNIAANFDDVPTLINSWLNSEHHRENLLDKSVNEMGGGVSGDYYSLIFIKNEK
ncbi:CAP-associated domain-containing protein [Macrococcus sp. DPC7161]|uniref:CAP-associated domain-containing protein n=1 Tax=Macrococcus sp. DPC7161 TaxID=2507060 RepID=UPI00100B6818|nr:CAP-associated domain-containing protein [Macrococcus sp. DPC7161]RXK18873.1 SCP-like extracellular protein [Macrococcus sp. DPC7161]